MKYNRLGETSLLVSELSFGTWVSFSKGGQVSEVDLAYEIMIEAYMGGVNFFDNAEVYSHGEAETLMGKAVNKGIKEGVWTREELVLSTKLFFGSLVPKGHPDYKPNRITVNSIGLSRKHIVEGMKSSLKRMNLEYVDLVFCHRYDPLCNLEEVVRAFNFLIDQGLCFYWGTSEWTSQQIEAARGVAKRLNLIGPAFDQPEYNMFERTKVESQFMPLYPEVGLTIWSPLASGILTGKYKDGIPEGSRMALDQFKSMKERQSFEVKVKATEKLRPIAEKLGCSLAQLALAWCMRNPNVSTVIGGATSVAQVQENLGAIAVIDKLTPEIMKEIETAIDSKPKSDPNDMTRLRTKNLRGNL